ncbi:hypothetical protein DN062_15310 [Nitrincola tibetensis]|uniref:AAA+ ATPase domain-containing protein n=1 Tax=Nitrincola tibetensis TaxID=2219697 RepID=A0A364NIS1_9GAMM|nr:AAA family ATPase [Nitrincola tibetensis]RAU16920.1 hypothetical protein DN062_15310 [Nitrincola tibetensis]
MSIYKKTNEENNIMGLNKLSNFQPNQVDLSKPVANDTDYRVLYDICQEIQSRRTVVWNIRDIMQHKKLIMMLGASESGKSFMALDMSLSIATGLDWHSHAVNQGPVVYVACEGLTSLEMRAKAWFQSKNLNPKDYQLLVTNRAIEFANTDFKELIADIEKMQTKPELIVIDTLSRASLGLEENSSSQMTQFMVKCELLKNYFNSTVLLIHHCGHKGDRARGTSALKAGVDHEIIIQKSNNGLISVTYGKDRDSIRCNTLNFVLDPVEFPKSSGWQNDDGSEVTSAVLRRTDFQSADVNCKTSISKNCKTSISKKCKASISDEMALEKLKYCLEHHCIQTETISGKEVPMTYIEEWKKKTIEMVKSGIQSSSKTKAFSRAKLRLSENNTIKLKEDYVYIP